MRTHQERVRLFESDLLERLSRVHPLTPALLWSPIIGGLLWRSLAVHRLDGATVAMLGLAGLVGWTLTEYLVHRFVFHLRPSTPRRRRLQFVLHGVHHAAPDDPTRLLFPPLPALIGHAVCFGLFRLVLGGPAVEPFFAGFLVGYLVYDYLHLAIHRSTLPTRWGRHLRRQHMLHHHATPEARWGVSSPLWDHVFGTADTRARLAVRPPVPR
jgi:sterol desaturase/sphingolipid hydroxylase (fatty acid hydroxylase superfamily)